MLFLGVTGSFNTEAHAESVHRRGGCLPQCDMPLGCNSIVHFGNRHCHLSGDLHEFYGRIRPAFRRQQGIG